MKFKKDKKVKRYDFFQKSFLNSAFYSSDTEPVSEPEP
jgi:hypothetical protein